MGKELLDFHFDFGYPFKTVKSHQGCSPERSNSEVEARLARLQTSLRAANTNLWALSFSPATFTFRSLQNQHIRQHLKYVCSPRHSYHYVKGQSSETMPQQIQENNSCRNQSIPTRTFTCTVPADRGRLRCPTTG